MSPFLFCMWIHGNLCPLKGSEPTEQTRTSRKCLNLVPSSTALGHLINTGVGLRTIFLNCVLEGDIIPAGQAQVDAWWAFGTWQRICCPRGAPGSSRAHIYTYHPSTHLPTAGERGPQALTEGVGAPCSSPQLGQQLWPEEGDGHSPPQHHPHALRGCSTRAHHQQRRAAVSPSRPTSQGPKWWQMHVSRVKSHYTPPPLPAHMGTGHNAAFSLQLAEETTQPFTGSSWRSLGVDWALQPSHGGSVLPNRPFMGLQPSFSSSRLGKPSMKQTEGQKTTHKNTQKPRKIGLWNNSPERSPKAWVGSRVNWCLATASFHLFKFR